MRNTTIPGIFSGCLLLSDIDGTLLTNGVIPERNLEAIRYFKEQGGLFSISTGRSIEATRPNALAANVNAAVLTSNGAVAYDFAADTPLYAYELPESAKTILPDLLERFPTLGAEPQHLLQHYILRETPLISQHLAYEHIFAESLTPEAVYRLPWTKVLLSDTPAHLAMVEQYAETIPLEGAYFLRTADIYYELTCAGVSKGRGLQKLGQHYQIVPEKIFAIGDYYNDQTMLEAAGVAAVTAGAPADLKSLADYVTCPVEDGAVADFIDYLANQMQ